MHVRGARAGHLPLLEGRHPAVGIEDEDRDPRPSHEPVDRRRPGVAGGGAEDVDRLVPEGALARVEVSEELERHVLEREGWPVEELQHVELRRELEERRYLRSLKAP